jgi:hypothetical protein
LVLLTIVVRLIVEGDLPDQIGREGFGWKRSVKDLEASTEETLQYIKSVDGDLQDFKLNFPGLADDLPSPDVP